MDDAELSKISAKLDTIIRLLAHSIAQHHDTLETKALALSSAGLGPKEIAEICATTAGSVSVQLARARKKRRRR